MRIKSGTTTTLRRAVVVAGLLIVSPGLLSSQENDSDPWYINQPIADVIFEGLENIGVNELEGVVAAYLGRPFTEELFNEMQRRLYALDYFSAIVPDARRIDGNETAVLIAFRVTEYPLVDEIRFVGNNNINTGQLLDQVLLKRNDIVTIADVRIDEGTLHTFYLERGYTDVGVQGQIIATDDAERVMVEFTIDEGNQVVIGEIRFFGNTFVSDATLKNVMQSKSLSILNRGTFQELELREDRVRIERFYRERGHIDAIVRDIIRESIRDEQKQRTTLTLTVFIEEGRQYTYDGITFEGNQIFSDETLLEKVRLQPGRILNVSVFEADFQRVTDLYYQDGYIFNTIDRQEIRDEVNDKISYVVTIVERDRAHIENVIIRGNTKTRDNVIIREMPFEVGEVFSATRIRQGILNLYNLQYFSAVAPETPQGSAAGLMELIINVEEAETIDVSFGLAFGGTADFPVALQASIRERNFLGRGQTVSVTGQVSTLSQQVMLAFIEPWLLGERWEVGTNLSFSRSTIRFVPQDVIAPIFADGDDNAVPDPYTGAYVFNNPSTYNEVEYGVGDFFPGVPTNQEVNEHDLVSDYELAGGELLAPISEEYLMEYILWSVGLGLSTNYRIPTTVGEVTLGTSLMTNIRYIDYDNLTYRPFNQLTRDGFQTALFINKWGLSAFLDTRDLFYSPSSGYNLGQRLTFTGGFLFGARHYIRTDTGGEIFFTLFDIPVAETWNWKMVLGLQSTFSVIFPHFIVPAPYNSLEQPVATSLDLLFIDGIFNARGWTQILNGEALWNSWVELRMPLSESIIWFDLFFESAAIWLNREDIGALGIENMLFSTGFGLRFTIPQFPIRFYLAKRFRIQDNQVEWQTGPLFNGQNDAGQGLDFVFSFGYGLF